MWFLRYANGQTDRHVYDGNEYEVTRQCRLQTNIDVIHKTEVHVHNEIYVGTSSKIL